MRLRGRWVVHLGVLGLLGLATLGARWDYTPADSLAALESASRRTGCVAYFESGGSYSPNLIGRAGELGLMQLLPDGGLLDDFYARGYTDAFDPYQAVAYADMMIAAGYGRNWTPILWGYC